MVRFLEDLKELEDGEKVRGRIATCPACKVRFIARKNTAYCSDKCRQKTYRDDRIRGARGARNATGARETPAG